MKSQYLLSDMTRAVAAVRVLFMEPRDIGLTVDLYRLVFCQVAPLAQ